MGLTIGMLSPFFVRCGVASYTKNLCEGLADLGCEVLGIRLPRFGAKTSEILQLVVGKIPLKRVDLIHVQHEYGLYGNLEGGFFGALKRLGLPIVSTMHAVGNWEIDQTIGDASDMVITHNEFCAKNCRTPSVIIPHGCSPSKCVPMEEAKRSYGLRPEWPIVGYLGFISNYKGLEQLIEAMVKVPEAALLIGGGWHTEKGTGYIQQLKKRSLELLPGRVQWLGYVADKDMPRAYGAMDLVVYPSRFATESGALLTALSHGKAVISSRLAPFREKEKLEALTTFKGLTGLRRKIRMLIGDEDKRKTLEDGARSYAESVKWFPNIAEKHISLYKELLECEQNEVYAST